MHPRIVTTLEEEEEDVYVYQLCGISRAAQWTTEGRTNPFPTKCMQPYIDGWLDGWGYWSGAAAAAATHGRGEEASFRWRKF